MESDASPSLLDPIEGLAEEYLRRIRRGEHPTPADYAAEYPQLAARILELFPALELLEGLKPRPEDRTGPRDDGAGGDAPVVGRRVQRMGDYTLLRELGRGGMGIVHEAEHCSLKNRVALKVMHPRFRADRTYLRRFRTEARSAARLHHTNIVPVFDFGEENGVCYYAMQYIDGIGLDRVLDDVRRLRARTDRASQSSLAGKPEYQVTERSGGPVSAVSRSLMTGRFATVAGAVGDPARAPTISGELGRPEEPGFVAASDRPPRSPSAAESFTGGSSSSTFAGQPEAAYFREIARLGAQVADALDYAHRQNVIHRDIKPSNLLLDAYGNVWVTDFGLAKLVEGDDLSGSHDLAGTLRFMAPERFRGVTDRRGDIYALGADALRAPGPAAGPRGARPGQAHRPDCQAAADTLAAARFSNSPRPGNDRPQDPVQGPRRSVQHCRRAARRAAAVSRWTANPMAPGRRDRAVPTLVQAQPLAGRGEHHGRLDDHRPSPRVNDRCLGLSLPARRAPACAERGAQSTQPDHQS